MLSPEVLLSPSFETLISSYKNFSPSGPISEYTLLDKLSSHSIFKFIFFLPAFFILVAIVQTILYTNKIFIILN